MKLEEKIRIFGHYLFCKVTDNEKTTVLQAIDGNSGCINGIGNTVQLPIEDCKLLLRDIKTMSRKDACKCAELANLPAALYKNWQITTNDFNQVVFSFPGDIPNYRNMIIFIEDRLNWKQIDYLRSQGYAIGLPEEIYQIDQTEVQL